MDELKKLHKEILAQLKKLDKLCPWLTDPAPIGSGMSRTRYSLPIIFETTQETLEGRQD